MGSVGSFLPVIWVVTSILCFICWVMGLVYAVRGEEKEVPILGKIKLLH